MPSLHFVLCRGAFALGLVVAGICGGHASSALSTNDARIRPARSAYIDDQAPRIEATLAQTQSGQRFARRTDTRTHGRASAYPLR